MGLVILNLHAEVFVTTLVARNKSLVDCLGVNEQLECRTRLALGSDFIVVPCIEVYIADPCLDGPCLWLNGYEGAVHEPNHIADGVHTGHFGCDMSLLIVEEAYLVLLVHVIVDTVGLIRELCL